LASSSGALLAQPAITTHIAAIPIQRVPRITILPARFSAGKNPFAAVNSD
jgi:hypothetical protein